MRIKNTALVMLTLACLSACGGGGGGNDGGLQPPPPSPPVGGITRTGLAAGPISTFGSVVVNGVRYETDSAVFTIDDSAGTQSDLSVGQIVLIKGTINDDSLTGTAEEVSFDDNVQGPVESIDIPLGQLVVLGQLVITGADTSFDDSISPASLAGISVGDIVEVSGFVAADGTILATHIEDKPDMSRLEVHGIVSNLDSANFRFSINGLLIDYLNATINNFPSGQISDGDFVETKGASLGVNGELLASSVELENIGLSGNDGDHIEVEGLITQFVSVTDFDVSNIPVTTDGSTVFLGGIAADLGLNVKVEVEGDLDANGVIVADKVDIRRGKVVRATAVVDSVDSAGNSLVMLGINFTFDALTRFEDKSSADLRPLTIGDINVDDYLEIRGGELPAGSGQILATIVERDDVDTRTILQGFVSNVMDPTLTILGVTIETSGAIFRDTDDSVLTSAQFFSMVGVNSLVKARGTESSTTTMTATEVEFEFEL